MRKRTNYGVTNMPKQTTLKEDGSQDHLQNNEGNGSLALNDHHDQAYEVLQIS